MLETRSYNPESSPPPPAAPRQPVLNPVEAPVLNPVEAPVLQGPPYTQESLRECAWVIGEKHPAHSYTPPESHVAAGTVHPRQGFVHWRIKQEWIERIAREKSQAWNRSRMVVRVYDVTHIIFNGLNAHRFFDLSINSLTGQQFFGLSRGGTSQLAEAGFVLTNGEFIAAGRSQTVQFPPDGVSSRTDHAALMVDEKLRVETVSNLWEQEAFLTERRKPKLRCGLRVAMFAFESEASGHKGTLATFVSQLAKELHAQGNSVHVFVPRREDFPQSCEFQGAMYHPLDVKFSESPLDTAHAFARAAESRLKDFPDFDVYHVHEWMAGMAPWLGTRPTIFSLTSTEALRRGETAPSLLSLEIEKAERDIALMIDCILTPDWLRERAIGELAVDGRRIHPFPMEGRLPNEWEAPLDVGRIKIEIGFGPLDRVITYVGPIEHASGVDIMIEALPTALSRHGNLRLAVVGLGQMHGHLQSRANSLRVAHAVHMLGHVQGPQLTKILRASEAVILPSRHRFHHDEQIVALARKAGKAVITTHGGPAHMVQHEKNGIITYDNPGSMVWALDRIMGDGKNTERMGQEGKRSEDSSYSWSEVARRYLMLCAENFPELSEKPN